MLDKINLITYKNLSEFPRILHFTTTRRGGVSEGNYSSFNQSIYSGDDEKNVFNNRLILANHLEIQANQIIVPYQVHEDIIQVIPSDFHSYTDEKKVTFLTGVDALITNFPDFCIGVTTADCVPILLYDPEKNVIAAIHAGWKGTVKSIAEKTVVKMQQQFGCNPQDIRAAIGPCISKDVFEVGTEVYDAFQKSGFQMNEISFFNQETEKYHIDLVEANNFSLLKVGLRSNHITSANMCTFLNDRTFFSARKLSIHSGRMLSAIMLYY